MSFLIARSFTSFLRTKLNYRLLQKNDFNDDTRNERRKKGGVSKSSKFSSLVKDHIFEVKPHQYQASKQLVRKSHKQLKNTLPKTLNVEFEVAQQNVGAPTTLASSEGRQTTLQVMVEEQTKPLSKSSSSNTTMTSKDVMSNFRKKSASLSGNRSAILGPKEEDEAAGVLESSFSRASKSGLTSQTDPNDAGHSGSAYPWINYEDEFDEETISPLPNILSTLPPIKIKEGQRLPSIEEHFSSCEQYLAYVFTHFTFDFTKDDWDFILNEVVETLPAFDFGVQSKTQICVTHHSVDVFILSMCKKAKAFDAALSYYERLKEDPNAIIGELPLAVLFRLMSSCPRSTLKETNERGCRFESICGEILERKLEDFHVETLVGIVAGLANTPQWRKALDLGLKMLAGKDGVCYAYSCLALAALHKKEYQIFWEMLNSVEFHMNIINVREQSCESIIQYQDLVYLRYLRRCQSMAKFNQVNEAWNHLENLFSYFRKICHCVRPKVRDEIRTTLQMLNNNKKEYVSEITKGGNCRLCNTLLETTRFTDDEISKLKETITAKVLHKGDVYISSYPAEIERFNKKLSSSGRYDVIIDGLNVALYRWPKVRMKNYEQQSVSLYETLRVFEKMGLKTLVIQRSAVQRFPHYRQITDISDVIIFDNVTQDDPFVLVAALTCGPNTMFVTNDTLRQHFQMLQDTEEMRLFTRWQLARQITFFQQVSSARKGQIKMIPNLYFPKRHSSDACRSPSHWHIPIDGREGIEEGQQRNLIFPKNWICVSTPNLAASNSLKFQQFMTET